MAFVDYVLSKFTHGTVTMVYNTKIEKEEVDEFLNELRYMFTHALDSVNVTANTDGNSFGIYSFDRHYSNLDYVKHKIIDVVFRFNGKLYKATLLSTNTKTIKPEDYNFMDETEQAVTSDFGIHMGYDNGYMPIHMPQVEIIGYNTKPQYYYMRGTLIAHPIEGNTEYAGVEEWKAFFSKVGKMSQQKVPNLSKPFNYFHSDNKLKATWESFYNTVISEFKTNIQEWTPKPLRDIEDMYTQEKLDAINHSLEKVDLCHCDSMWKFRFGYNVDEVVKYDNLEKTVIFKFDEDSPLLRRLVKGGRDGRNGRNDIDVIIIPTIDIFKMDIEDENTTDKVISAIKKRVRKFNNYYTK